MAWRIDKQAISGEIDNRMRDRVTGRIWLKGLNEPVILNLEGNPWRDMAGNMLRFTNPDPEAENLDGFALVQEGVVGDITASRKVKVPDCSMDEVGQYYAARKPLPWHWGNSLYLEWYSKCNGRVVIESATFKLEIGVAQPAWTMTPEDEVEQQHANAKALSCFMALITSAVADTGETVDPFEDDKPQSLAEAEADAVHARVELLLDRTLARLEREGLSEEHFDRLYMEERENLRIENGEPPEPELTPKQETEQEEWIQEMNAIVEEGMADDSEAWWEKRENERHPLVERCHDLAIKLHHDVRDRSWLPENAHREHPMIEIVSGMSATGSKLAGALNGRCEWPPPPIYAGDALVRLKKVRNYLRDVLCGLDVADEQQLADKAWRTTIRRESLDILGQVNALIRQVREVLHD